MLVKFVGTGVAVQEDAADQLASTSSLKGCASQSTRLLPVAEATLPGVPPLPDAGVFSGEQAVST